MIERRRSPRGSMVAGLAIHGKPQRGVIGLTGRVVVIEVTVNASAGDSAVIKSGRSPCNRIQVTGFAVGGKALSTMVGSGGGVELR